MRPSAVFINVTACLGLSQAAGNRRFGLEIHTDKLLVSTKFAPPRIGTLSIPRSQLIEQLQRMEHCTVGLVIGSPGFGKTTLLVQWRQTMMRAGAEVAWLSLSADDKHLSTFFAYLRGALNRLGVTIDTGTPLEGASNESSHPRIDQWLACQFAVDRDPAAQQPRCPGEPARTGLALGRPAKLPGRGCHGASAPGTGGLHGSHKIRRGVIEERYVDRAEAWCSSGQKVIFE
ncbi:hypothetical protein [Pseudomonas akapageensis]|uniref:hypothetical protein n=1 Tax=Pseudomonas akapageensis TaxID=2609961 RepID=UPI001FE6F781|nr:hypothetical protein [Pseudomonas akapageensis]